ncbi:SLC13 family permease [Nonomuraea sp. MG754425]|uniref:SLC13 family permease n=1 Tax=Nonomuraea sp. MG754425 TaxID=2570319 RepID=UPI001F1EFF19|nr:SLC13 family permease [Nonomuraea sp. MG754425]
MEVHLLAIGVLALAFLLGALRGINLGAIALVGGGAMVLLVTEGGIEELYAAFPADLFVLLVGVTFLFGIAAVNGTIEWVVDVLSRSVRGRASVMPWLLFFVAGVVTSLGALAPVVVGLVAPIGMRLAKKHGISPRLAGLMILHGACCGNFSPVNLLGATVNSTLERAGLVPNPMALFAANIGYNVLLGVVIYCFFGGLKLWRAERVTLPVTALEPVTAGVAAGRDGQGGASGRVAQTSSAGSGTPAAATSDTQPLGFDRIKGVTLAIILVVGVIAMVGKVDLGILALSAAVVLVAVAPKSSAGAAKRIAWDVVLLICGVVTYVGLLNEIGTIKFVGDAANSLGSPLATAFLICLIGAVVSAFASSAGIIAVLIPLAMPFLLSGQISVTGMAIAVAISATVVDSTPFSTIGAVVLSNADPEDRDHTYRGFLSWGALMVLTAPILTMAFVLPGLF